MIKHPSKESNPDNIKPVLTINHASQRLHVYDLPGVGPAVFLHDFGVLLGYRCKGYARNLHRQLCGEMAHLSLAGLKSARQYSPALPRRRRGARGLPVLPVAKIGFALVCSFNRGRGQIVEGWVRAIHKEMHAQDKIAVAKVEPPATIPPARAPEPAAPSADQIVDIDWSKLVSSEAPDPAYPVDFEYLWMAMGISRKQEAVRALRGHFSEGADFCADLRKKTGVSKGRPVKSYWLTENCARELCMVPNTDRARQVRRYFIAREAQAKRLIEERQEILQRQAAPAPQDPLAMVERGIALFEQLGGVDERDRLFLRDVARNALAKSTGTPLLTAGAEPERGWTVGERITHLGYRYSVSLAQRAGRKAAQQYRSQMGQEPPAVDRYVDGAVRPVKLYAGTEALVLLDEVIAAEASR